VMKQLVPLNFNAKISDFQDVTHKLHLPIQTASLSL
jgi:hypothetical protein